MAANQHELEKLIFECAERLFFDHDYEDVSMKMIARECNIAVGTLYNYYFDKAYLYIEVVKNSWDKTIQQLLDAKNTQLDLEAQLYSYVEILYHDTEIRHGLGVNLREIKGIESERLNRINNYILNQIQIIFDGTELKSFCKDDDSIQLKLIHLVLSNLYFTVEYFPNEKNQNIRFIHHSIYAFINQSKKKISE